MYTTKEIVDILEDYLVGVPRTKILRYLNRAYMELIDVKRQERIFTLQTGDLPYPHIMPVDGVREYLLDEANLKDNDGNAVSLMVKGVPVYIADVKVALSEDGDGEPYSPEWSKKTYRKVLCEVRYSNNDSTKTSLYLLQNGVKENIYLEAYYKPYPLTSERVPMIIDTDKWLTVIINGAVGYYEDVVNGKSERLMIFREKDKRRFSADGISNNKLNSKMQFKTRRIG